MDAMLIGCIVLAGWLGPLGGTDGEPRRLIAILRASEGLLTKGEGRAELDKARLLAGEALLVGKITEIKHAADGRGSWVVVSMRPVSRPLSRYYFKEELRQKKALRRALRSRNRSPLLDGRSVRRREAALRAEAKKRKAWHELTQVGVHWAEGGVPEELTVGHRLRAVVRIGVYRLAEPKQWSEVWGPGGRLDVPRHVATVDTVWIRAAPKATTTQPTTSPVEPEPPSHEPRAPSP